MAPNGEDTEDNNASAKTGCMEYDIDTVSHEFLARAFGGLEDRLQAAMEMHTKTLITAMHDLHTSSARAARAPTKTHLVSRAASGLTSNTLTDSVIGVRRWAPNASDEADATQDIVVQPVASVKSQQGFGERDDVRWQWQSTAGPWKDYDDSAHERLEKAFREGETHLRLKSGLSGKVPMEVFFVDMVQRDPASRRVRKVRRKGPPLSHRERALRHGRALLRYVTTGKPMYESLAAYRARQSALDDVEKDGGGELNQRGQVSRLNLNESRRCDARHACKRLVKSGAFAAIGVLVLLVQCWWIWYSTDVNAGVPLYDQSVFSNVIEHFFCAFFASELAIHVMALRQRWYWYFNQWLCLDAVCVVSSMVDVIILPPLALVTGFDTSRVSGGEVLRVLRLVKIFRICRIFGHSHVFSAIIKGTVGGMRSAAFILALLAMAIFAFGVLMRVNSDHELLEPYFGTLDRAMVTLLTRGLFLDGVRNLIESMVEADLWTPLICFGFFMYITFFGLMSMLIGAFCSVADSVHKEEEDRMMTAKIASSLRDIVECYVDNDRDGQMMICRRTFALLLQNPDMHMLLKSSGTDIFGLVNVMNVALAGSRRALPFSHLLDLIVHLRAGKSATVSDVAHLEGFVLKNFKHVEQLILAQDNNHPHHDEQEEYEVAPTRERSYAPPGSPCGSPELSETKEPNLWV